MSELSEIIQDLENATEAITYCSYSDALSSISSALDKLNTRNEWIPVSERLPDTPRAR